MPKRSTDRAVWGLLAATPILLAVVAAAVAPAHATYRLGVGDQNAAMFSTPAWQNLGLKRVRYLVPWDWARTGQAAEVDAFMSAARAHRQDVLVTFNARHGCYDGRRYSRAAVLTIPERSGATCRSSSSRR